ncbi:MAG: hypothetical protein MUF80_05075 [Burkholderiales bacterium]|jgi:hypothetical protein|nr:hypothetical protein [Burkholderiales bacterium]
MAEYEAHIIELQKDVGALQRTMVEAERNGGPPDPLATFTRLSAEITAYADVRDRALNGSLLLLIPEAS